MNAALQDAATLGVTVTVASGDNGSTDGDTDGKLHVDFPASSPYALACGGTTLMAADPTISSETVWNETAKKEGATGGGVSTVFRCLLIKLRRTCRSNRKRISSAAAYRMCPAMPTPPPVTK